MSEYEVKDKLPLKEKQPAFLFELKSDPELYALLDKYRRSLGWTWKRFVLVGIASVISSHDDNPDLVMAIADYIDGTR